MKKLDLSLGFCILLVCTLFSIRTFAQDTLDSESFESGMGIWSTSGNAVRINNSNPSCGGSRSIRMRQNSSAILSSSTLNLTSYTQIDFSFCHKANSDVDTGEGVNLEYFDGTSWIQLQQYRRGTEFSTTGNGNPHNFSFTITTGGYTFPTNARFRIVNNTNNNSKRNIIDNIEILGYTSASYCASNGDDTSGEYINRVQLNTLDNTPAGSGAGTTSTGYSDFTALSTDLTINSNYTITVSPFWSSTNWSEAYSVWIDYNQDGDFTDSGEQVWSLSATSSPSVSGSFTIPATALTGSTRMRVSMRYNTIPSSCGNFDFGEVEDYTVNITSAAPQPEINIQGNATNIVDGDTTPNTSDDTEFGSIANSTTLDHTFTIQNTGSSTLNLTGSPIVSISGNAAFSVLTQPSSNNITSGGSDLTFIVRFAPTIDVTNAQATISISNNDANEDPYTFVVQGSSFTPSPEINIQGNGNSITDGDTTPNATDDTEFGSIANSTTLDHTFTIQNTGNATLNLNGAPIVSISGNGAFSVLTQPSSNNITSGGSDLTFVVRFAPTVDSTNAQATISISNNDANEDPYTFVVQGSSFTPQPEINIQGNGNTIADGDTTPSTTDDTNFGDVLVTGGTGVSTFTIQNLGSADLNLTGSSPYITISGSNAADFSITSIPSSPISPSSNTTFAITFDPSSTGLRQATITIANNDSSESSYSFDVQGNGVAASYCSSNGDSTGGEYINRVQLNTLDNTPAGSGAGTTSTGYSDFTALSTDLTINSNYTITVSPFWSSTNWSEAYSVWIDYNQDGDFTDSGEQVWSLSATSSPSVSGSFTIPATALTGSTRMRVSMRYNTIPSSCGNFNFGEVEDYTVNIISAAPQPEINIQGNGTNIADGDTTPSVLDDTDFGNVDVTLGTNANTFTIQNTGSGILNLTGASPYISISGTNAADFSVTAIPSATISASGTTTFSITFNPSAIGLRSATISIANNDSDEPTYTFNIQGNGTTTAQEIDVLGNGISIADGDTTPSLPDHTDFGNVLVSSGTIARTFTIENYGTVNSLNLTGVSPYITITGTHSADFTVTSIPSNSIAGSSNTTFVITFNPSATGLRTATITIDNNDADESSYTFNIQGSGTNVTGPGGVSSGLQLWLKSTDGLAYTDGQSVSIWQDQGNASDAVAPVSGVEPTYKDNITDNLNFNPVVDFDNNYTSISVDSDFSFDNTSTQFLQGSSGYYSQDVFVVLVPDVTVTSIFGSMDIFCGDEDPGRNEQDGTGLGFGRYTSRFSGEIIAYAHGTAGGSGGYGVAEIGTGSSYSNPSIINIRNNSGATQQELFLNATDIETNQNDVADFANVNNSRYWIGRSEGWEASTDARIAEIITFSSRKSDTDLTQERNRIQSYLAVKYGITLGANGTSQDYVNSDGNVIWDQSVNSGYNYDVAGIGRDDNSTLIQKQSSSINNASDGSGPVEGILTIGLSDIYDTNNLNINNNTTNFSDKQFLMWGNNGADLNLAATTVSVDMSSGVSGLTTPVTFTAMQRVWKVVETGGDVPSVKIRIPQNAIRNITPPGNFLMFISNTTVFDPTADYRVMTADGSGNLETDYNFDGTKYITFGYAPQVVAERSVYFNGSSDYIDVEDNLDLNNTQFTISAWIKRGTGSTNASIISKRNAANTEGYDLRLDAAGRLQFTVNGNAASLTSSVVIPENKWHEVAIVYNSGTATFCIDGVEDTSGALPAPVQTSQSFLIGAADGYDPNTTDFFTGNIDEVRVWNIALTIDQLRYIMNQEISHDMYLTLEYGDVIPTSITNNEISSIPWTNLAAYYPMQVFTYTNTNDMSGNNLQGALRNLNTVDYQTAPLPYRTQASGSWDDPATWLNNTDQILPNSLSIVDGTTPIDWNIVEIDNDVYLGSSPTAARSRNCTVEALIINSGELQVNGDNGSHTGIGLTVSHYLKLDGVLDLEGESQLIQTNESDLDVTSAGTIEKDQQGTRDLYTYNYWSSPVSTSNTSSNNNSFSLDTNVLKNGTISATPNNIMFSSTSYDGAVYGNDISIADYWIWKYANQTNNSYSSWQHVRSTGTLNPGEGFTMKGVANTGGVVSLTQNYVFDGKPNNGDISLTISAGNDYLIGNPYPSAIDANEFIMDNISNLEVSGRNTSGNIINGALYFWDHFGGGNHNRKSYEGGYATYTLMGGVPAVANDATMNNTGAIGTKTPGRYIPVGQGFFVSTVSDASLSGASNDPALGQPIVGGNLVFQNSQRAYQNEVSASSTFLKNTKGKSKGSLSTNKAEDTREKIRLLFDSPNGYHREILVGVQKNTSQSFDIGYDAILIDQNHEDMFWNFNEVKYSIQSVDNFNEDQILPLGLKTQIEGLAHISIKDLDNIDNNKNIYLFDSELNIYHNLRENDYEVHLTAGEHLDRFEIVFNKQSSLSIEEARIEGLQTYFSNERRKIIVHNSSNKHIKNVEVYNMLGQSVENFNLNTNENYIEINAKTINTGVYLIKVNTQHESATKKVLVE
ncbi:choice-of-anchor D domain-containing protein [Seonamhaeicola marinus]|uniref:Choice-of-anchor D domain-containing protein n=1 Tax=Seonamhaeicola marinus TaxID=1912246 RepID=A0A5D0JIP0_9FLAO|nr:choice-of-anchor D domain-containing protein [Seonamhaeicola marinus]TYA94738.1 choice-of-anchor D domain-containing protein [Seonamhaeicola marinus]